MHPQEVDAMVQVFAPAKINLTLHVTGQRSDGYHLLDSLVMFADFGDSVTVRHAEQTSLQITGPIAEKTPQGGDNLVVKAAELMGVTAHITLDKKLPIASGMGGGASDAAATLRALAELTGRPIPEDVMSLGSDTAVCGAAVAGAARMTGVGEAVTPITDLPELHAVLVNPNVQVHTADIYAQLKNRVNPPMPDNLPSGCSMTELIAWLAEQRNDLQETAMAFIPVIEQVFNALSVTPGCLLQRMSGSGGTCFGLYGDAETAASAAGRLKETHSGWWVEATRLNVRPKAVS